MQEDFHYYATYCAAYIAGYSHEECMDICYSAQFTDLCTRTFLTRIKGPRSAATTQLQLELMDAPTDIHGLQDITRIWASFHFLPGNLYADVKGGKAYRNKYRLICDTNGELLADTVNLAKKSSLQAAGIAMHVLADTWAHRWFAGTPSLVINNTNYHFFELIPEDSGYMEKRITFKHNLKKADDPFKSVYINSLYQFDEHSIMNLGHGRAGHLPDYSFIRYKYLPAWKQYEEVVKDNPSDYYHAFCQMIYAMKYLRGIYPVFELDHYDTEAAAPWEDEIRQIIRKRQLNACDDWRALGEKLSGQEIEPFDLDRYEAEYVNTPAEGKDNTFLGKFILAALSQKSMVTNKIFKSGNMLAGYSVDYDGSVFRGIRDFRKLVENVINGGSDE